MPTVQSDGHDIHYEIEGSGPALMLIHGAAASGRQFDSLRPLLAKHFQVLIPDLRGLGRSSRVAQVTPREWIEDLRAVLADAQVRAPMLCGVSLGSRIAARFVLEDPERFSALIVDAPLIGISTAGNTALNSTVSASPPSPEQVAQWEHMHGADWSDVVSWYFTLRNAPGFQEYLTVRGELGSVSIPTLICRGDNKDDVVHPLADAIDWHAEMSTSELWISPGAQRSQSIAQARPEEFVAELVRFREQHGVGKTHH